MKTMFDAACVDEIQQRFAGLRRDQARQWGKMSAAQMLAHCSKGLEMAAGEIRPPRALIGRIIGGLIKRAALGDDKPIHRNSPTSSELVVEGDHDFAVEKARLSGLIDRFAVAGPAGCTCHPHAFFGPLAPDDWGILMYKHLDHHLRQFGA
ncbi:MAG TPA: DUF1569 domain-containing protein [Terracidiphilus sp.]|nr:DUF1569 domain-containing protein [Terracidiphilus sp.]